MKMDGIDEENIYHHLGLTWSASGSTVSHKGGLAQLLACGINVLRADGWFKRSLIEQAMPTQEGRNWQEHSNPGTSCHEPVSLTTA